MIDVLLFLAIVVGLFTTWLGLACLMWRLWWTHVEQRRPPLTFWQALLPPRASRKS